ncbi:SAM-dependent methyltransferase [Propionivibrio sp.]|jgi:cyclopropane-fatty-acyl-phospholipid synthase|uniref:SAM-dependent methyltransferase n=1 Tax=Propionivibrio sp. TaxID=2212460 RepID=UPI00272DE445|nr:cyclopropane-fatty-acyl-phospholipid synthase family protein [Propionivibrio sp.]
MFWEMRFENLAARLSLHDIPVRIALWNGQRFDLGRSIKVMIHARTPAGLRQLVRPSLDALGSAYVEGHLDVEGELGDVFDVAAGLARHAVKPTGRFGRIVQTIKHTKKLDADAIAYHYDVSNDFYRAWLDEDMVYSCAYFKSFDDSLEQAQRQKLDHVLTKIRLQPGQHLLDIGCGWGALIMRAAQKYGARATGITLSRHQCELAQERIAAAGLADRCEVHLADYRDMSGKFDRITSIGMFEHVGLKNLHGYFAKIRSLLGDDGIVLNHGITSTDPDSGQVAWGAGAFINRYVFPHGELPHISLAIREMSAAGLEVTDVEGLRRHYALTLKHWAQRYEQASEKIHTLVDERRYRIWRMYLAGCAYAFDHAWTSIHQILAVKADRPDVDRLPLTRDYIYRETS